MAVPFKSPIDMGSNKIVSLADPTSAQDAASKAYADTKAPINAPVFTGGVATIEGTAGAAHMAIKAEVDGSKYSFSDFEFFIKNSAATPIEKLYFSSGAEGHYSNAGVLSAWDFYIYNDGFDDYSLFIDGPTNNAEFFGAVTSPNFISSVATGTQPYATTSTTLNANLNADKVDGADLDTDGTLAANSDVKVPSQKAVKTYVDANVASGRATATVTTASLVSGTTENGTVTLKKSFILVQLSGVSAACRVRLYATAAARTADALRTVYISPTAGAQHGIIFDAVISTSGLYPVGSFPATWLCSPPAPGANMESVPSANIAYAITNLSGSTQTISVTFVYLSEEA